MRERQRERTELRHGDRCSPAACAAAGRHGDAKDSPNVMCEHCWTVRWNGVELCAKRTGVSKILTRFGGKWAPQKFHICTRAKDHAGPCSHENKLVPSYVPR